MSPQGSIDPDERVVATGLALMMRDLEPGNPPLPRWRQAWRLLSWLFRWCGFTIPVMGFTTNAISPDSLWPGALMIAYTAATVAAVGFALWYRRHLDVRPSVPLRVLIALELWLGTVLGLMMHPALQSDDPERYALVCLLIATVSAAANSLVTAALPSTYFAFVVTAQVLFVVQLALHGGTFFRWLALGSVVVSVSMGIIAHRMQRMLHEALLSRFEQADTSDRLRQALALLDEVAATDDLTGLANRRRFLDLLSAHITSVDRAPACVIMFDIDHFKDINDSFGHATGDQVLQRVADAARSALRAHDAIARVGGEEFAIVCRARSEQMAAVVAERIRVAIEAIDHPESALLNVTASFGVAQIQRGSTAAEALDHADIPLYLAKSKGRNRVELAGFPVPDWPGVRRADDESDRRPLIA
jgi:diguanylate cyclase (GGDEF)-like protein